MNGQVEPMDMDSIVCLLEVLDDITEDDRTPYNYVVTGVDHIGASYQTVNVEIEFKIQITDDNENE